MHHITLSKKVSNDFDISRKRAEEIIKKGLIFLNKKEEKRPFIKVLENCSIELKKEISKEKIQLIIFNKPKGCITSRSDEESRKTVYDFLPKRLHLLHYIGRLDYNTEGLLLFTNDTRLKRKYENPKSDIIRRYIVKIEGSLDQKKIQSMNQKIYAEFTYKKPNIKIISQKGSQSTVMFELQEGKNREIRKICELFNLRVKNLKRINFGKYHLKGIALGSFKEVIIR